MTNRELYELISKTKVSIANGYKMIECCSGLTEDEILGTYQMIEQHETKLEKFLALYENQTGHKFEEGQKDLLFEDTLDSKATFDDSVKNPRNARISGNARLATGRFRTDKEQEEYIEESLERDLP